MQLLKSIITLRCYKINLIEVLDMLLTTKNVQVDTQEESKRNFEEFYDKLQNDPEGISALRLGRYIPLASAIAEDSMGELVAVMALTHAIRFETGYSAYPKLSITNYMSSANIDRDTVSAECTLMEPTLTKVSQAREKVYNTFGFGWDISVRILDSNWMVDTKDNAEATNAKIKVIKEMVRDGLIELERIISTGKTEHMCFDIRARATKSIATNIIKIVRNNSDSEKQPTGEPVGLVLEAMIKDPMFVAAREIGTGITRRPGQLIDISPAANKDGLPLVVLLGLTSPSEHMTIEGKLGGGIYYFGFRERNANMEFIDKTDDTSIALAFNRMIDKPYKILFPSNKDMSTSFKTKYLKVQDRKDFINNSGSLGNSIGESFKGLFGSPFAGRPGRTGQPGMTSRATRNPFMGSPNMMNTGLGFGPSIPGFWEVEVPTFLDFGDGGPFMGSESDD